MNTETPFVVLSAFKQSAVPDTNAHRHRELLGLIRDFHLTAVEVEGCYHGILERSILVFLPEGDSGYDYDNVRAMARAFNQESIVYVDANRYAYLDWLDWHDTEELGKWGPVPDGPLPSSWTRTQDGRLWTTARGHDTMPLDLPKVA